MPRIFSRSKEFGKYLHAPDEPTTDVFEQRIAAIEGGTGALGSHRARRRRRSRCSPSPRSATRSSRRNNLYGGTTSSSITRCRKLGRTVKFSTRATSEAFSPGHRAEDARHLLPRRSAIRSSTCPISRRSRKSAHEAACRSWWTTPWAWASCARSIFGVDIVVASATKYIGGHGTSIGGVIVDSGKFAWNNGKFPEFTEPDPSYHGLKFGTWLQYPRAGQRRLHHQVRVQLLRDLGPALSPFNSFLFIQGLEQLPLRPAPAHRKTPWEVARFLKSHPRVAWVTYPGLPDDPNYRLAAKYLSLGFGGWSAFGITAGARRGAKFFESVKPAFAPGQHR